MKFPISIFLILIFSIVTLPSQTKDLRSAHWVFGTNCHIDFTSGQPIEGSEVSIDQDEGVATISDIDGKLLFYTDGATVYSSNGNVMQNGNNLYGHESSSQSAIIVPLPGNNKQYYVFTVDDNWSKKDAPSTYKGFCYSIVDMSLNNGLGEVITKNVNLLPKSCEKVTAVGHRNGEDFWVITQVWPTNLIVVYKLTKNGIEKVRGDIINSFNSNDLNTAHTKGYMKFSPNSKKLAVANNGVNLAIYDFNNATGALNNEMIFNSETLKLSYGIEFSPNMKYLYVSSYGYGDNDDGPQHSKIIQLDISSNDIDKISKSEFVVNNFKTYYNLYRDWYLGALQIGLDKKIYLTSKADYDRRDFLSVINKPNEYQKGCDFVLEGFKLKNGSTQDGLPTFIQSFFLEKPQAFVPQQICEGDELLLTATFVEGVKYRWEGPNGFVADTNVVIVKNATSNMSGKYSLTITYIDIEKIEKFEYNIVIDKMDISINMEENEEKKIIDREYVRKIEISNNSNLLITIDDIKVKTKNIYKFSGIQFPLKINPKSTIRDINLYITPKNIGISNDSLLFSISSTCDFDTNLTYTDNIAGHLLTLTFQDTTIKMGKRLYYRLHSSVDNTTFPLTPFDMDVYFSYNVDYFTAQKNQFIPVTITKNNDKEMVKAEFKGLVLNSIDSTLNYFKYQTLFADEPYTDVIIDSVKISNPKIEFIGIKGHVQSIEEICNRDIYRIKLFTPHSAIPIYDEKGSLIKIQLSSPDQGELDLKLFNTSGQLLQKFSFLNNTNKSYENDFWIDTTNLTPGLYILLWESKEKSFKEKLLIQ